MPRGPIGVKLHPGESSATLVVGGEIDLATAPALREQLLGLVGEGYEHIEVDLDGVDFCDSTGLGVFVGAHRRLRAIDGTLVLTHAQRSVRHLFEVSGLDQVLHLS